MQDKLLLRASKKRAISQARHPMKLTQTVIRKCNLCDKTTVKLCNEQIYIIPRVDKKTEFLLRIKILVPITERSYFV